MDFLGYCSELLVQTSGRLPEDVQNVTISSTVVHLPNIKVSGATYQGTAFSTDRRYHPKSAYWLPTARRLIGNYDDMGVSNCRYTPCLMVTPRNLQVVSFNQSEGIYFGCWCLITDYWRSNSDLLYGGIEPLYTLKHRTTSGYHGILIRL